MKLLQQLSEGWKAHTTVFVIQRNAKGDEKKTAAIVVDDNGDAVRIEFLDGGTTSIKKTLIGKGKPYDIVAR